jgi:peptide/nickel transport system substrate-binding protein
MRRHNYSRRLSLLLLLGAILLIAAQCGQAPVEEPALAPAQEEAQPVEDEAAREVEATAETGGDEAAGEEAESVETETDVSQEVITEVVEESESVKAVELEGGVTIVTDELDVSARRTQPGGDYRDVSTSDAVSFHPYLTTDGPSGGYQGMVYSGALLRLHEDTLDYIPNMAESYSIAEDGLTFTFHLRQDLKWSDGEPLTAHDFKWTYDQVINPDNEFPYLSQLEFITSYEALDDYTLEIKIDEIYAPALGQMSGLITPLPKHIWENLDWADPETNPEINSPSVVSGPYKLVEWKRDQFVIFEANENYWYHGAPNISRQTLEIVPDQDIAYQKMKNSETDTGPITPEKLEEARQLEDITVYEWWPAAALWSYLGLNLREGFPTHDINVRHGLSYAIDKQTLTDEVMLGQGRRLCSPYPDTSWVYNPDLNCYDYNPDQAIAEFSEAGYTFQDGKMLAENGEQLSLTLLYGPNTSQTRELIALAVQDDLSDIGIEVEIQALEWSSYLASLQAEEPDWDITIGTWGSTIEPHIMYTIWAEENIPALNFVGYVNKDVEALYDEAGATYDTEFRKQKYQEIQKTIVDEAPYVFLFYNKTWSGQNNRVQGIDPRTVGIGWNLADWFILEESTE